MNELGRFLAILGILFVLWHFDALDALADRLARWMFTGAWS